jgi:hypothetical protein
MKDIPFKRKLKHLKKDFQRRNILFLDRINEIKKFFFQYGAYCANENNLERILKFENNDSRRFKKLLIRLGKAAKKKNSLVRVIDIINIISDESCCYVFENYECVKISDPREIVFYKYYKINATVEYEREILEVSEKFAIDSFYAPFSHGLTKLSKNIKIESKEMLLEEVSHKL